MVFDIKFDSIAELATFQQLALQADKPVYIANEDDTIRVDARSVSATNSHDNLKKCLPQCRYAGRVTDVKKWRRFYSPQQWGQRHRPFLL